MSSLSFLTMLGLSISQHLIFTCSTPYLPFKIVTFIFKEWPRLLCWIWAVSHRVPQWLPSDDQKPNSSPPISERRELWSLRVHAPASRRQPGHELLTSPQGPCRILRVSLPSFGGYCMGVIVFLHQTHKNTKSCFLSCSRHSSILV